MATAFLAPAPVASTSSTGGVSGKKLNYRQQLAETYKHSLPLVPPPAPPRSSDAPTVLAALSRTYLKQTEQIVTLENPRCVGTWDPFTGSVWVDARTDGDILWTRGNFGKGSLSRSEPSWWKRTVRELTGSGGQCKVSSRTWGRKRGRQRPERRAC
jgi:tRNA-splicing endonuclease subunit Sen2